MYFGNQGKIEQHKVSKSEFRRAPFVNFFWGGRGGGGEEREENMDMDLPPPGRPLLTKLDLVGIKVNRQTTHMAVETRFTDTSLRIDSFLCPSEKLLLFLEFNR